MLEKGWDCLMTKPGVNFQHECPTCGRIMDVERGVLGATSFAESIGGGKHLHDFFSCPSSEEPWHEQVKELKKLQASTPSPTLKGIYEKDMEAILKKHEEEQR